MVFITALKYDVAITTTDNPWNPFENFDEWYAYDTEKGYYSCARLAREAVTYSGMSDEDYLKETERVMDNMVKYNITGVDGVSFKKLKVMRESS